MRRIAVKRLDGATVLYKGARRFALIVTGVVSAFVGWTLQALYDVADKFGVPDELDDRE